MLLVTYYSMHSNTVLNASMLLAKQADSNSCNTVDGNSIGVSNWFLYNTFDLIRCRKKLRTATLITLSSV